MQIQRLIPTFFWKLFVGIALALVIMLLSPGAANAQDLDACYTGLGCTANDFSVSSWVVQAVLEDCYNTIPGHANQMYVDLQVTLQSLQPDRYDAGLIISAGTWDVSSVVTNDCYREGLFPATVPDTTTLNLFDSTTGYLNSDNDTCGDLDTADQAVVDLDPIWIACEDNDKNGYLDVSVCAVYDNNGKVDCYGTPYLEPGTNSKCNCFYQEIGITPTAIRGLKLSADSPTLKAGLALGGLGIVLASGVLLSIYLKRRVGA